MGIPTLIPGAIFLDRDGVLNPLVLNPASGRRESPLRAEDLRLVDGAAAALGRLRRSGYSLILVSNQPNYALGKCSLAELNAIHAKLLIELDAAGICFARFCYCLHHPKGVQRGYSGLCACRKPSPWFLLQAADELRISLAASWMIGDQPTDTRCGQAAGVHTVRIVESGTGPAAIDPCAELVAADLCAAVDLILSKPRAEPFPPRLASEKENLVSAAGVQP
jgi:D-glycero-D-manno-heptose 1,7-bisphosphate phosphatase